ncbi:MAG: M1 family aminopeptidase [Phycisphaerales bacterium]
MAAPLLALALLPLAAALTPDPPRPAMLPPPGDAECGCDLCAYSKLQLRTGLPPTPGGALIQPAEALTDSDVLNYHLDIEVLPGPNTISGSNTITVRSLVPALTEFTFELQDIFAISAITINGTPLAWMRPDAANTKTVRATLDRAYTTGEQFDLRIAYSGVPNGAGFGSITFTTMAGQPLVCTLSETRFAHTWWPVKEDNNDKATGAFDITVPDNLVVVCNGVQQGVDTLSGSRKRYRWSTGYATSPYLFSFSAAAYATFGDTWTYGNISMPLSFFISSSTNVNTANNRAIWLRSKQMLTAFSDRFGAYPFAQEKYGIYQFSFNGGMEHQTCTGQGNTTSGGGAFNESITAHELMHQWFGDNITCATWNDIWLNESFATYGEALWYENRPSSLGSNGTAELIFRMSVRRPTAVNDSVYVYDASIANEGRIFSSTFSYRKGAWALHMLRHVMGDTAYFQAMNSYRAAYQGRTATTAQFQAQAEAAYGGSLDWFFQQWIYQIGAPTYQYAVRPVDVGGQHFVELYIKQIQNAAWPTFAMPLDVVCTTAGGSQTLRTWNNAREEHLLLPATAAVTGATLDPDNWVLAVSNDTDTASTTSKTVIPFVEGPPKIVAVSPAPSDTVAPRITPVRVTFHKPVNAVADQFALIPPGVPVVPATVTFAYDAPSQTVTLTPQSPLIPGVYTVTVNAALTDSASNKALDGEPNGAAALPSGDGLPGGDFAYTFTVAPACSSADVASLGGETIPDRLLTVDDIVAYLAGFFGGDRAMADISGLGGDPSPDGQLTVDDLVRFLSLFFAGCP